MFKNVEIKISMLNSNRKNIKDSKQISRLKIKWDEKTCLMKLTDDLDTAEERISEPKNVAIETIQDEIWRETPCPTSPRNSLYFGTISMTKYVYDFSLWRKRR